MDDVVLVSLLQGQANFKRVADQRRYVHWPASDYILQRLALQPLHCDKMPGVPFFFRIDRTNIWMIQFAGQTSFAPHSLQSLLVRAQLFGQELQGDKSAQVYVSRLIDHSHAAWWKSL